MNDDQTSRDTLAEFLSTPLNGTRPFVLETRNAVSLHFDHFSTQSCMSRRAPDRLTLGYTRTMMGFLLLQPAPRHICMIGLGGGSLAKYCHKHLPEVNIIAVEIDPAVIALRDVFRIPIDDTRFRVVCANGADYVQNDDYSADIILVDAYVSGGIAPQCTEMTFLTACRERLTPTGVLAINFTDDDPALDLYVERLNSVFGTSYALVRCEDDSNFVAFGWKDPGSMPSPRVLLDRAFRYAWADDLRLAATARRLMAGLSLDPKQLVWRENGHAHWEPGA
ncbi:spermidine synthase [Paraburkholderia tropica]|uniref:Spermidine synthase n=1 Tax=Paraburkholderia tropica TaxID=92647 RepID=A0ABX5MD85_9BURK|nr:spermidine synthase [Paraburkholderia tropica]PXX06216.1 spermidine synthase [Paraburkholderia tropica]PZW71981.1 spermidine synthase [Paraburkholderia tropica]